MAVWTVPMGAVFQTICDSLGDPQQIGDRKTPAVMKNKVATKKERVASPNNRYRIGHCIEVFQLCSGILTISRR